MAAYAIPVRKEHHPWQARVTKSFVFLNSFPRLKVQDMGSNLLDDLLEKDRNTKRVNLTEILPLAEVLSSTEAAWQIQ